MGHWICHHILLDITVAALHGEDGQQFFRHNEYQAMMFFVLLIELSSYSTHFVLNPGVIASSRELEHSMGLHDGINAREVPSGWHTVALRIQSADIAYSSKQYQCVRYAGDE